MEAKVGAPAVSGFRVPARLAVSFRSSALLDKPTAAPSEA
jgi:hypothetical protein